MLGEFLKTIRIEAGLSQRDVSDAMGYTTPQFVSNNERSISAPPIKDLRKLAKLYGINADKLFEKVLRFKIEELELKLRNEWMNQ